MLALRKLIEQAAEREANKIRSLKRHKDETVAHLNVNHLLNGNRALPTMLCQTSNLHPTKGILLRNLTVNNMLKLLPKINGNRFPSIESILWLLLTGSIPTHEQTNALVADLAARSSSLPSHVEGLVRSLPSHMHPMTKFSIAILALQPTSSFLASPRASKQTRWILALNDSLNLIAALPRLTGLIYRESSGKSSEQSPSHPSPSGDFCDRLYQDLGGIGDGLHEMLPELLRLHLVLHADHEGGNASTHTARLVGSTLADPFLSLSAAMNALAGPLHGRASQDVLSFLESLRDDLRERKEAVSHENIRSAIWRTLNSGNVIPGYGHAVLRSADPRYLAFREFATELRSQHSRFGGELLELLNACLHVVPSVLREHGRTSNPHPNIDAHSGVLLDAFGLKNRECYTVLFGVGRAFGILSQLVWDRALQLPIERPKSVTADMLLEAVSQNFPPSKPRARL